MANYVIIISRIHSPECIVEVKIFKGNKSKEKKIGERSEREKEALKFFFFALNVINN